MYTLYILTTLLVTLLKHHTLNLKREQAQCLIHSLNNSFSTIHPSLTWHLLQQPDNRLNRISLLLQKHFEAKAFKNLLFFPLNLSVLSLHCSTAFVYSKNTHIVSTLMIRSTWVCNKLLWRKVFTPKWIDWDSETPRTICVFRTLAPFSRWAFITPQSS